MTRQEVEQKIIEIAHEFAKRYGEEVLELNDYELIAYITPLLPLEYLNIFRYYETYMLAIFRKTVKEDLKTRGTEVSQ
jgi:hypothetical protein